MREDRQLLAVTHLTQLLDYITGLGGFIVPLVLWITKKDEVIAMDHHGKAILNFQLSMFIYALISIPLILFIGLGIFLLIAIGIIAFVFPIINAIKASNGESIYYPLSIKFF